MTLTINLFAGRHFAIQASDRRLTYGNRTYPLANKQVFFCNRDSMACAGYSGDAHIGDVSSDDWIAATLAGSAPLTVSDARWTMGGGEPIRHTVGYSLGMLAKGLEDYSNGPRQRRPSINIFVAGFKTLDRRGRMAPFSAFISHKEGRSTLGIDKRYWGWESGTVIFSCTDSGGDAAMRLLKAVDWSRFRGPEEVENAVASVVKSASQMNNSVGPDCTVVRIGGTEDADVSVRYIPADLAKVTPAYTPWLILPNGSTSPPTIFSGGTWYRGVGSLLKPETLGLRVRISAPSDDSSSTWTDSQPPPPRVLPPSK